MKKEKRITRRQAIGAISAGLAAPLLEGSFTTILAQQTQKDADYSLQQSIPGLRIPDTVTVVGCGGFGSWPALFSALVGVKKLLLFDRGSVDTLDLARAPFLASYIGKPKVESLKDLIGQLRPNAAVETYVQFFTPEDGNKLQGEVVFDGTNDMRLAQALPDIAKRRNMKYVQGFYQGQTVGVANGYIPGIQFKSGAKVPVWAGGAALSGILAVHSAFLNPITFVGNVSELNLAQNQVTKKLSRFSAQHDK